MLVHKSMCLLQTANQHVSEIQLNSLINEERIRFKTVPKSISIARLEKAILMTCQLYKLYKNDLHLFF